MRKVSSFLVFAFLILAGASAWAQAQDGASWVKRGMAAQLKERYSEAFQCFRVAADKGNAEGQYHVGYAYLTGQGVEHSDSRAVTWLLKAAAQGEPKSQVALGNCYENGWWVPRDPAKAKALYQAAIQSGYAGAQAALAQLEATPAAQPTDTPTLALTPPSP